MGVHEMLDVAGGLEWRVLGVAVLATERRIDLGMADEAIGHLRQGRSRDVVGILEPAVAGLRVFQCRRKRVLRSEPVIG